MAGARAWFSVLDDWSWSLNSKSQKLLDDWSWSLNSKSRLQCPASNYFHQKTTLNFLLKKLLQHTLTFETGSAVKKVASACLRQTLSSKVRVEELEPSHSLHNRKRCGLVRCKHAAW